MFLCTYLLCDCSDCLSLLLQPSRCANQIEEVCKDVEKTINQTIQNTLNTLEKDCEKIAELVDQRLKQDA